MKTKLLFLALLVTSTGFCQALLSSTTPITPYLTVNSPVGEEIGKIIDGDINTKFSDTNIADGIGFQVNLSSNPATVVRIDVSLSNNIPNRDPQNFQLSGSNDGITYTSIYNGVIVCGQSRNTVLTYSFTNIISYGYYRVNFTNLCGNQSTFQVAEVQLFGSTLSVNDAFELKDFVFYPNPVKDVLSILNNKNSFIQQILVTDVTGKVVENFKFNNATNAQQLQLSNLSSGIYLIKIVSQNSSLTKKIIIE
ncbi:T9SS type A sorting domain-containing protein [Flavobacterium sp.]|uniref:T9SS type A sorting domain-containing protein n=1 Tax=Flavobacterium sp. TaxID=239 RepID=UPI00286D9F62|nr:T9SS type A sorting domain-containing protein [Flavobacterium sp.]